MPSPLLHAPQWMKRPAGACFGFGGKLAAFKTVQSENGPKTVVTSICQVGLMTYIPACRLYLQWGSTPMQLARSSNTGRLPVWCSEAVACHMYIQAACHLCKVATYAKHSKHPPDSSLPSMEHSSMSILMKLTVCCSLRYYHAMMMMQPPEPCIIYTQTAQHCLWKQVVTERALVEQSGAFEQAVMSNDKAALADYCASKATQAVPEERESWAFMQMLFQNDSRRCRATSYTAEACVWQLNGLSACHDMLAKAF